MMKTKTKLLAATIAAAVIVVVAALVWSFSSVDHLSSASQSTVVTVDCDFDKFRQIMVRMEDPALDADELVLRQQAEIKSDRMRVVTESKCGGGVRVNEDAGHLSLRRSTLLDLVSV